MLTLLRDSLPPAKVHCLQKVIVLSMMGLSGFLGFSATAMGQCLGKTSGKVTLKVLHCKEIIPKNHFGAKGSVPPGFYDLYPTKQIIEAFRTYRGSLVVGDIQQSQAFDPVLSDKQALLGQKVTVFIDAPEFASCADGPGESSLWTGTIAQVCCNDSINAPCLLDTSYILSSVKRVAKEEQHASSGYSRFYRAISEKATQIAEVNQAREAFKKQDIRKAINLYEEALGHEENMPLIDHYVLGIAYYLRDGGQCGKGIPHLEKVHGVIQTIPGRHLEGYMKRSQLLLARCHSLAGNVDRAVLLLREMLTDPGSFKEQIETALYHEDFGWINSTKQYQTFIKEALRGF